MVVNSLNDLSIAIYDICKRHNIQNYIDEFKSSVTSEVNSKFWDKVDDLQSITTSEVVNPLEKIMIMSSIITDDELNQISKINKKLNLKYSYADFVKECESARRAFLRERAAYFSIKVAKKHSEESGRGGLGTYFDITGMTDVMLAEWLDALLEKIYPNHLDIEYEDINGKRVKTKISHRICVVSKDYIESPLIDRYHGTNAYDQFYLHSVYDIKKRKWIYLPVRLIVNIKSEDIDIQDLEMT
jgi:disulfide oxidoreductase YuzD